MARRPTTFVVVALSWLAYEKASSEIDYTIYERGCVPPGEIGRYAMAQPQPAVQEFNVQ